jgi:dynein heavy chain
LGASSIGDDRKTFDRYLKRLLGGDIPPTTELKQKPKKISYPERGTLYEYIYQLKEDKRDGEWVLWVDLIDKNETIPNKMQPHEIIVKTQDTVRYSYLLSINIKNEIPTLFCGPTGTGKVILF